MMSINWNGYTIYCNGTILNKDQKSIKSFKINHKGYAFTNFYYDGKLNTHTIHKVIWKAFKGVIPDGYEIDHINNDRKDNRLSNLQLLTKSQNNKKAYDSGNRNFIYGQNNPNSLTRELEKQNG